jgi:hypothetical protein
MPYNPGIQYTGDRYLYEAVSGLGRNIAQGIETYRKSKQENQAADAAFETLVSGAAPLVAKGVIGEESMKELGDPSKFSGLSLSAKKAKLGQLGVSFKMLIDQADREERQRQEQELAQYRNATLGMQREEMDERSRSRRDTLRAIMQAAPAVQMDSDNTGMGQAYLDQAIQQNPDADPQAILDLLTRGRRAGGGGESYPGATQMLEPFDIAGRKGLYNRRTGQTMQDQNQDAMQGVPIRDEEGNILNYAVQSGNRTTIVPPRGKVSAGDLGKLMEQKAELRRSRQFVMGQMTGKVKPEKKAELEAELEDLNKDWARVNALLEGNSEASKEVGTKAPASEAPQQQFKAGDRVKQGGAEYQFDGTAWQRVK